MVQQSDQAGRNADTPPSYQATIYSIIADEANPVNTISERTSLIPDQRRSNSENKRSDLLCAIFSIGIFMIIGAAIHQLISANIEEGERMRAGLRWEELHKSDRCLRYGTRKYWARLQVPKGYDALKGCRETEIEIHGRKLLPNDCDNRGKWGGVLGTWIVDFNEGSCGTYWSEFYDQGCTAGGSGLRRIHAVLYNYNSADDWNDMCSSTPAKFNGLSFDAPTSCTNYGDGKILGFWDVDDGACR